MEQTPWSNWGGTQSCDTAAYVRAETVDEVCAVVARASEEGITVRPVGSGHSFPPIVPCSGIILDISSLSGVASMDRAAQRARVGAGTRLKDMGDPMWEAGLSLMNQGDIDAQTVAGAVSTATHGSGLRYTSFSGIVTRAELVTAAGEILVIEEGDSRMPAVQTSLGSLGVLVDVELQLTSAYKLAEKIEYWPLDEVLERWLDETKNRRHFQIWWGPYEDSLELYDIPPAPPGMKQACYVRRYDELPADVDDVPAGFGRADRAYRIYAAEYPPGWDELEYFVPYEATVDALAAVRLVLDRHPDQRYPVEVRTIGAETSFLSAMHGRDSVSISVSGAVGTDYLGFLRSVDEVLREFQARPHWGKTHFFDADRLREVYPRYDDFVAVRRALDPQETFLNDHLRSMIS